MISDDFVASYSLILQVFMRFHFSVRLPLKKSSLPATWKFKEPCEKEYKLPLEQKVKIIKVSENYKVFDKLYPKNFY